MTGKTNQDSAIKVKFGKIDRSEPLSVGGTGDMEILSRTAHGEWVVVGQAEVDAVCTYYGSMSSFDRFAVDVFEAYLFSDTDKTFSVSCFDGRGTRIRTAAEAKRILKAKIVEALASEVA